MFSQSPEDLKTMDSRCGSGGNFQVTFKGSWAAHRPCIISNARENHIYNNLYTCIYIWFICIRYIIYVLYIYVLYICVWSIYIYVHYIYMYDLYIYIYVCIIYLHICIIYILCIIYMYYMRIICVLYMYYICIIYVLYMYYICLIYVLHMYYICIIYVLYMVDLALFELPEGTCNFHYPSFQGNLYLDVHKTD